MLNVQREAILDLSLANIDRIVRSRRSNTTMSLKLARDRGRCLVVETLP